MPVNPARGMRECQSDLVAMVVDQNLNAAFALHIF